MNHKFLVTLIFAGLLLFFVGLSNCDRVIVSTQPSTETANKPEEGTPTDEPVGQPEPTVQEEPGEADHILFGNPSNANTDASAENNYLITKPQYVISYSRDRGIPNWISWHVNKDWIGEIDRQDDFRADNTLPAGWYQVTPGSYSGSGFDRGHNCPSGDRTRSEDDNSSTFIMTNMIPQAPRNNRETWGNFEEYTRKLVREGNEVYVIMGSYGQGGEGTNGPANTLDKGRVTVPANIWKVVLILPEGEDDLNRVTTQTKVIAINTPNKNSISPGWGNYRTTIDEIEKATGYDLLSKLPVNVQEVLESSN